jgi:hypothetical protein
MPLDRYAMRAPRSGKTMLELVGGYPESRHPRFGRRLLAKAARFDKLKQELEKLDEEITRLLRLAGEDSEDA